MTRYLRLLAFGLFAAATLPSQGLAQVGQDDLLPPDEAFKVSGEVVNPDTARFTWTVADGYYLYKSKLRIEAPADTQVPTELELPSGKVKQDDYFGEVETYRHRVAFDVPLQRSNPDAASVEFIAKSQGCADVGVCYPPQARKVVLNLPATTLASATPAPPLPALPSLGGSGARGGLAGLGGGADEEQQFLDPEVAFSFSARAQNADTLVASWDITDGYYLYRHRFKFELIDAAGITLGEAAIPKGKEKEDEFFGQVEIYRHRIDVPIPLSPALAEGQELTLKVGFQGCADAGLCYPPQKMTVPVIFTAAAAARDDAPPAAAAAVKTASTSQAVAAVTATATPSSSDATAPTAPISESDSIAATLAGGNTALTLLIFFGFGLALTFTPCVFPMIPILSSIIVGQGSALSTRKAFTLSLVYVLAMELTYTVAGVIAGVAGGNLQAAFQNPWVLGSFASVFVLLSLSMFGFYELQLPNSLQSRLTEISNRQEGGSLIGVAIMGLLSALIVGPCVAPPLMGALIYISQSGDALLGGAALFFMSMGMGVPLLIIGTLGGKWLPRAGGWMDTVKAVFGVMLLGVAIWMLERIIPGPIALALWAALFLISAVYMSALDSLPHDASGWRRLTKGLGVVFAVYGVLLLIGALSGGDDMFRPLHNVTAASAHADGGTAAPQHADFTRVKGTEGFDQALQQASAAGKPVLLDFYADWCVECKRMERYTFSDAGVISALSGVTLLQADVTDNDDLDQALLQRYTLLGPPALLFFDTAGNEMRPWRFVGYKDAAAFTEHVNGAFADTRQ